MIVYYPWRDNMGRHRGSKNKTTLERPVTSTLSSDERIKVIANLIVRKMIDDQKNGYALLKHIQKTVYGLPGQD